MHEIISGAHEIVSRAHEIVSRAHEIVFRGNEILFRRNGIISGAHEIVSRVHEIVPYNGYFCGCLIFAEFCGSIQIAEIKIRKLFQSSYNDEIMSEVIVQSRIFRCLSGTVEFNICIKRNTQLYNVHPDMRLSFKWQAVFEIKSVLVIVDYKNIP